MPPCLTSLTTNYRGAATALGSWGAWHMTLKFFFYALQSLVDEDDHNDSDSDDVEVWESDEDTDTVIRGGSEVASANNVHIKLINFLCTFLLLWQTLFRIPNVAMGLVYKFMSIFLKKISEISSQNLIEIHNFFPDTLKKAQVMQSINCNNFEKLIVCPKCYSTYEQTDCTTAKCSYVRFPRHPQLRMCSRCNEDLMKTVKTASGKKIFVPLRVFCYRSIIDSIKSLIRQPGMLDLFSKWKQRNIPDGVMSDIYDGEIFSSYCGQ